MRPLPNRDNQNCLQILRYVPLGAKAPLVENRCVRVLLDSSLFLHTFPPDPSTNAVTLKMTLSYSLCSYLLHPSHWRLSLALVSLPVCSSPSPHLRSHSVPNTVTSWLPLLHSRQVPTSAGAVPSVGTTFPPVFALSHPYCSDVTLEIRSSQSTPISDTSYPLYFLQSIFLHLILYTSFILFVFLPYNVTSIGVGLLYAELLTVFSNSWPSGDTQIAVKGMHIRTITIQKFLKMGLKWTT